MNEHAAAASPPPSPPDDGEGMALYTKILLGMLVGVVLGFFLGPNSKFLPQTAVVVAPGAAVVTAPERGQAMPHAQGVGRMEILERRDGDPDWFQVKWTLGSKDVVRLEAAGVTAEKGDSYTGWVEHDPVKVRPYAPIGQKLVDSTEWVGRLFLAMIKMVVVPLVFFSLI
ncbi:MAG: hypothetical protein CL928_15580, partial [Deltaproteobacteria bacterium]|nr:hypothetical protein [Deltaproteobacteria bacterium]